LFVDFTKAFDRVDHNILLTKLKDRGIPHCLVKGFHSYLSFRCQTVRVDNQYSDRVYITAGMPQDSPLGLLSFLLLIDDLSVDCLTHKYVDDTTLTELLPRGSEQRSGSGKKAPPPTEVHVTRYFMVLGLARRSHLPVTYCTTLFPCIALQL